MALPKVLRMGILPAALGTATLLLTQFGQDFPAIGKYASIVAGGLTTAATLLHPGLGSHNPWIAQDETPDPR